MKLTELVQAIEKVDQLEFILPDGNAIPAHFHITEMGKTTKHFIDCGGTVREEQTATIQLWTADDTDHRLTTEKLLRIIAIGEKNFGVATEDIQIEYQGKTKELYGLAFAGNVFHLTPLQTDCLAKENCGIPESKTKVQLAEVGDAGCCDPNSGCC